MNRIAHWLIIFTLLLIGCNQAFAENIIPLQVSDQNKLDLSTSTYVLKKQNITEVKHVLAESDIYWRQLQPADSKMIGAHNFWLQVELVTSSPSVSRFLEINNPHLDQIKIYHFINGELADKTILGDSLPFSQRLFNANSFYYPINIVAGQTQLLLIKIDTQGSAHLPLTLWSDKALLEHKDSQLIIDGMQLGTLLGIGCFSLFFAFASRSYSYGYYSGYVLCMTLIIATLNGYAFQYLWPKWPSLQQSVMTIILPLALAFALLLTEKILHLRNQNVHMLRFCRYGASIAVFLSGLSFLISYELALLIDLNTIIAVSIALMVLTSIQAYKGHKLAKLYAFGWGLMVIGACMTCLSYLGVLAFEYSPQTPMMVGLTLEIAVMSVILAIRYNDERKSKMRIQQKALVQAERIRKARESALTAETKSNAKLERMVQERTLELEMAYRELNEAHDKLKEQTTIDTLTGVKNRSAFDKKLAAESKLSRRQMTPIAVMMLDIDRFKLINDTYGHLAGDLALKAIATAIKDELKRPADIVSRYGGEEFAIILPTTDMPGALALADRIRKSIKSLRIEWQQQRISLTVSIGVSSAIITDDAHAMKLLEQADKALYFAKSSGRDQVQEYSVRFNATAV
ncbi:GGDEF domain-containing protein [Parashewanella spongiae]|uniref:diguanylate cyclase n=1 Tax=Parashewanella spongiae TaxID=342950 RepID=A0A3A6TGI7_9GAMM|nr:diguanylate cyclase [Parashewanella spongiae]MCL1078466.1 sensor domain-containing diguanylate cyclase [Parashewanella spongiae]RJY14609.1 GGDEF domain-containing protein [Parashewanella spongiae]